ncbi:hypothetical protein EV421DRAFT_1903791 [Armillaria borealis]|uniref:Uncharacterized protein n=1 Tax=Armillaria borealis TaxID=47425 RepID=A0AA39MRG6_9AGAR|nr:hypothetical protein EV421DRAFT_1903791 [Armillaria borealis]
MPSLANVYRRILYLALDGPRTFRRTFTARAESQQSDEEKKLIDKIISLETVERDLAIRYGMDGYIDSVEVLQEAKARASDRRDTQAIAELGQLDELLRLPVQLAKRR